MNIHIDLINPMNWTSNKLSKLPDHSLTVWGHSSTSNGEKEIVIFGGYDYCTDKPTNTTYILNIGQSNSLIKPTVSGALPPPMYGHSSIQVGKKMFIFGGNLQDNTQSSDMYQFNTTNYSWSKPKLNSVSDPPRARFGHSAALLSDHYILIFGGVHLGPGGAKTILNDMHIFNTDRNCWAKTNDHNGMPSLDSPPTASPRTPTSSSSSTLNGINNAKDSPYSIVSFRGRSATISGHNMNNTSPNINSSNGLSSSNSNNQQSSQQQQPLNHLLQHFSHLHGNAIPNLPLQPNLQTLGNSDTITPPLTPSGILDLNKSPLSLSQRISNGSCGNITLGFSKVQSPPPRYFHSCSPINNRVYIFGGYSGSQLLNDLYILNIESMEWIQPHPKGDIPSPRAGHTSAVIGNNRYIAVFGGTVEGDPSNPNNAHCDNELFLFDVETFIWTQIKTTGTLPSPRTGHICQAIGSKVFIVGGTEAILNNKSKIHNNNYYTLETLHGNNNPTNVSAKPRSGSTSSFSTPLVSQKYLFSSSGSSGDNSPNGSRLSFKDGADNLLVSLQESSPSSSPSSSKLDLSPKSNNPLSSSGGAIRGEFLRHFTTSSLNGNLLKDSYADIKRKYQDEREKRIEFEKEIELLKIKHQQEIYNLQQQLQQQQQQYQMNQGDSILTSQQILAIYNDIFEMWSYIDKNLRNRENIDVKLDHIYEILKNKIDHFTQLIGMESFLDDQKSTYSDTNIFMNNNNNNNNSTNSIPNMIRDDTSETSQHSQQSTDLQANDPSPRKKDAVHHSRSVSNPIPFLSQIVKARGTNNPNSNSNSLNEQTLSVQQQLHHSHNNLHTYINQCKDTTSPTNSNLINNLNGTTNNNNSNNTNNVKEKTPKIFKRLILKKNRASGVFKPLATSADSDELNHNQSQQQLDDLISEEFEPNSLSSSVSTNTLSTGTNNGTIEEIEAFEKNKQRKRLGKTLKQMINKQEKEKIEKEKLDKEKEKQEKAEKEKAEKEKEKAEKEKEKAEKEKEKQEKLEKERLEKEKAEKEKEKEKLEKEKAEKKHKKIKGLFGSRSSSKESLPFKRDVIEKVIVHLRENSLNTEGIFRLSGNMDTVRGIVKSFVQHAEPNLSFEIHNISNALKHYLRALDPPLIPYEFFSPLLDARRNEDAETIRNIFWKIPADNRIVLTQLAELMVLISENSNVNKMNSKNLSIVFGPTILKPRTPTLDRMALMNETQLQCGIIQTFIEDFHYIFSEFPTSGPKSFNQDNEDDENNTNNNEEVTVSSYSTPSNNTPSSPSPPNGSPYLNPTTSSSPSSTSSNSLTSNNKINLTTSADNQQNNNTSNNNNNNILNDSNNSNGSSNFENNNTIL
ncbi:hypothetical protein DICPUDRAFT_77981 [Dictyostelium purpureum]|uniref:Rho-GAP domain-containing protein n=1 Tax=Dictyostelium purpureum TaxID=5786 RepID=F0ZI74_DICPU|nr:uncharacterized protein DICPUDRAFT_77981 [Dictyostelium purpureum]EGC36354.1 hypothetical protein DICPUDRAFT_77981 [Dictyostelium purpureum]|eukprot:XP_003287108.1 hypothetical protein DICPUDRAFT_77981 [Dictyostelium purpureum]